MGFGMLAGRCIPDSMFTRPAARNLWKLFAATSISRIHASDLSPSRSRLSRSRGRWRHPAGLRAPIVLPATCPNFHTRRLSNKVGTEDYSSADLRSTSIPEVSTLTRVLPFVERSASCFQDQAVARTRGVQVSRKTAEMALLFETVDVRCLNRAGIYVNGTNCVAFSWEGSEEIRAEDLLEIVSDFAICAFQR